MKKGKTIGFDLSKLISICISVLALIISIFGFISNQESKPLAYYLKPAVTSFTEDTITAEIEVIVTNGAVHQVRVIDYKDGVLSDIANNVGGTIRKSTNKKGRTFEFQFQYDDQLDEFIMTEYLLIGGKDGSKELSMILYHVDLKDRSVKADCYSVEDLIFAELDPSQELYGNALKNYRELINILKENGEL
ncbi:MAG: hypothetical protein IJ043_01190 [Clostridia bacterium]|nr:hypothetical protein [Clostridia bacterium]